MAKETDGVGVGSDVRTTGKTVAGKALRGRLRKFVRKNLRS